MFYLMCSLQPPQLGLKTNPPLIQEKPQKTIKKPAPTKEELLKMTVCHLNPRSEHLYDITSICDVFNL